MSEPGAELEPGPDSGPGPGPDSSPGPGPVPEPGSGIGSGIEAEALARSIALRLLTRGPRSRAQLAAAMARKDVPDDVAGAILDRFTEVGLVDDAEYARMLVRARLEDRGLARRALVHELRSKGIEDDVADAALSVLDPDQEAATARELARRRLAGTRGLAREVRLRRVVAMLGRKGYSSGMAVRIVCGLLDEEDPGDTDVSGYLDDD